jgi:hypothetical protein
MEYPISTTPPTGGALVASRPDEYRPGRVRYDDVVQPPARSARVFECPARKAEELGVMVLGRPVARHVDAQPHAERLLARELDVDELGSCRNEA